MKPTKQQIEKMQKGKEESKPREVFKIKGWIVTCDKYNWTTHKGKLTYYFSTLENALYYIQMMEERKVEGEMAEVVNKLVLSREKFLEGLLHLLQGQPQPLDARPLHSCHNS